MKKFLSFIYSLILAMTVFLSCDKSIYNNLFTEMYTVTYDANESTGGTVPLDTNFYYSGYQVNVSANTGGLVRTGYNFICWNTAADGSGTDYNAGDTFTMNKSNVTLYAKWRTVSRIIFTTNRDGNEEIYIMDTDGKYQSNLSNNSDSDTDPCWSNDGAEIAFVTYRGELYRDIWVMNADGSGQVNRSNYWETEFSPSWSPNGTYIAYVLMSGTNYEIYTMNASDGSGLTQLTFTGLTVSNMNPTWSPDGTKIAFAGNIDGNYEIYFMNSADGSGLTQLTFTGLTVSNTTPSWSPF